MEYSGKYDIFDISKISTYPISTRPSKVKINDLVEIEKIYHDAFDLEKDVKENLGLQGKQVRY